VIAEVIDTVAILADLVAAVGRGVFRGDDHVVTNFSLGHPFTNPRLALLVLVVVRSVAIVDVSEIWPVAIVNAYIMLPPAS
jgi:hypothetical protein